MLLCGGRENYKKTKEHISVINILNSQDCCGCGACVQRCPKRCINLKEDIEGFLYPEVDKLICIDCSLCEKVCPLLNSREAISSLRVLAVKNRDENERIHSSSGGVFIELAKQVIDGGGVVFGAVYDENWEVKISFAETLEDVRPMMGSKYLQARVETAFVDAEHFLKKGRVVLFSGAPCQITGLKKFLRKDFSNLLAVDFLCHGVPSPGVWRRYLQETVKQLSVCRGTAGKKTELSSINVMSAIKNIEFRNKTLYGWKRFSFVIRQKSVSKTVEDSVLLSHIHRENPFMRGFLSDIYLRPSCYECKCKNGVSHSDLTIADFWGIDHLMPDFDDDKGIGLVLLNTEKGQRIFDILPMEWRSSSLAVAKVTNSGFKEHTEPHPQRAQFFRRFVAGESVSDIVEDLLRVSLWRGAVRRIYRFFRF